MRDAAEVRARVAGAARGRAEVRTPSPSSLSMVSGRSVLSQLQARRRMYRFTVAVCSLFLSWRLVALFFFSDLCFLKFRWWLSRRNASQTSRTSRENKYGAEPGSS